MIDYTYERDSVSAPLCSDFSHVFTTTNLKTLNTTSQQGVWSDVWRGIADGHNLGSHIPNSVVAHFSFNTNDLTVSIQVRGATLNLSSMIWGTHTR